MNDQRGLSMVELVVGALLASVVAAGLLTAYLATARSFGESSAQAALQRQGALALEDIGRQVRSAVGTGAFSVVTCNGQSGSLQVLTPSGPVCYYGVADGPLCEYRNGNCRNLLTGGLKTVVLARQPVPPDPRCPATVAPGGPCFAMGPSPAHPNQIDLAFAIRDNDGDLDGVNTMSFAISLTCSGRNC